MNVLVTICARAGSKGLPNKAVLPFNGFPLFFWTFECASQWIFRSNPYHKNSTFGIISTDSLEILRNSEKLSKDCNFPDKCYLRSFDLCDDEASKLDALRDAVKEAEKYRLAKFDCIIDLDITNPCRTVQDIENCFRIFEKKRPQVLFSAKKSEENPDFNQIIKTDDGNYKLLVDGCNITRRQDSKEAYRINSNIYIYDRGWLMDEKNKHAVSDADRTEMYLMPYYSGPDIDKEGHFKDAMAHHKEYYLETTKD